MQARFRSHIRSNVARLRIAAHLRHQWLGALALFLVLTGGTAYALAGSNTVFSDDIVNGEVKAPDVATNAVGTAELQNNGVLSTDVRDETLAGGGLAAADLRTGSAGSSEVANDSVTGAEVAEGTLGEVPSAVNAKLGGSGLWLGGASCDPTTDAYITCEDFTFDLPVATHFLVVASLNIADLLGDNKGECRIGTSATGGLPGTEVTADDLGHDGSAQLTTVTPTVGPGAVGVGVECRQTAGDLFLNHIQLSAYALAP
jgi:hypothetical protein